MALRKVAKSGVCGCTSLGGPHHVSPEDTRALLQQRGQLLSSHYVGASCGRVQTRYEFYRLSNQCATPLAAGLWAVELELCLDGSGNAKATAKWGTDQIRGGIYGHLVGQQVEALLMGSGDPSPPPGSQSIFCFGKARGGLELRLFPLLSAAGSKCFKEKAVGEEAPNRTSGSLAMPSPKHRRRSSSSRAASGPGRAKREGKRKMSSSTKDSSNWNSQVILPLPKLDPMPTGAPLEGVSVGSTKTQKGCGEGVLKDPGGSSSSSSPWEGKWGMEGSVSQEGRRGLQVESSRRKRHQSRTGRSARGNTLSGKDPAQLPGGDHGGNDVTWKWGLQSFSGVEGDSGRSRDRELETGSDNPAALSSRKTTSRRSRSALCTREEDTRNGTILSAQPGRGGSNSTSPAKNRTYGQPQQPAHSHAKQPPPLTGLVLEEDAEGGQVQPKGPAVHAAHQLSSDRGSGGSAVPDLYQRRRQWHQSREEGIYRGGVIEAAAGAHEHHQHQDQLLQRQLLQVQGRSGREGAATVAPPKEDSVSAYSLNSAVESIRDTDRFHPQLQQGQGWTDQLTPTFTLRLPTPVEMKFSRPSPSSSATPSGGGGGGGRHSFCAPRPPSASTPCDREHRSSGGGSSGPFLGRRSTAVVLGGEEVSGEGAAGDHDFLELTVDTEELPSPSAKTTTSPPPSTTTPLVAMGLRSLGSRVPQSQIHPSAATAGPGPPGTSERVPFSFPAAGGPRRDHRRQGHHQAQEASAAASRSVGQQ
ncbi:unnamed protein product, partial [Discosporangium mesarthrocarpum]